MQGVVKFCTFLKNKIKNLKIAQKNLKKLCFGKKLKRFKFSKILNF
jgi:hypothetical protein